MQLWMWRKTRKKELKKMDSVAGSVSEKISVSNQILSSTDINKRIRRHARSCSRGRVVHSNSHARLPFVQMRSESLVTPLTPTPPLPRFTDTKTHTHYFCATEKRVALLFLPSPALPFFFIWIISLLQNR